MLIFPAIDLRGGNAVRLKQGDFGQETVYDTDPVSVAAGFMDTGAEWLHVVDLDGARAGEPQHWKIIEAICRLGIRVQYGGGIRSLESAQRILQTGVTRFVVGTRLITDPYFGARLYADYAERVVAGIDARDGYAAAAGWEQGSNWTAEGLATQAARDGCRRIILTDIGRDGMLSGPNLELLQSVQAAAKIPVIQSGGIGSHADLELLASLGNDAPEGVIVGRALYEGTVNLADALHLAQSR